MSTPGKEEKQHYIHITELAPEDGWWAHWNMRPESLDCAAYGRGDTELAARLHLRNLLHRLQSAVIEAQAENFEAIMVLMEKAK